MGILGFNEAYRTDEFLVEIEGIESPGITKVSGLSEGEVDAIVALIAGYGIKEMVRTGTTAMTRGSQVVDVEGVTR